MVTNREALVARRNKAMARRRANEMVTEKKDVSYDQLEVGDEFQYRGEGPIQVVVHLYPTDTELLVAVRDTKTGKIDGRGVNPKWRVTRVSK